MAKNKNTTTLLGLVLLVVGIGLAWWGYELSESLGSQLTETFSGAMPDAVMYRYIGGGAAIVAGLYLLIKK
jgi:uncharacterized protein YjeT (DUF2065 family)